MVLGVVPYLNALPLWWSLRDEPNVQIVRAVPSQLAARLDAGEFDAALMPVADHLRGHGDGLLGDAIVGATGEVRSVLLFSKLPIREIQSVALDTSSHSSVALLRVITRDFYKLNPTFHDHAPQLDAMLQIADAALLIGDPALEARRETGDLKIYDLAEEWFRFTGLSFVFAAWTAKNGLENRDGVAALLDAARDEGMANISNIVAQAETTLPRDEVEDYLKQAIEYRLTDSHREGLESFQRHARQNMLLDRFFYSNWRKDAARWLKKKQPIERWCGDGDYMETSVGWSEAPKERFENALHFYLQATSQPLDRNTPADAIPSGVFWATATQYWPSWQRLFPLKGNTLLRHVWKIEHDWNEWEIVGETDDCFFLWEWVCGG